MKIKKYLIGFGLFALCTNAFSQEGYIVRLKLDNFKNYTPVLVRSQDGRSVIDTSCTREGDVLVYKGKVSGPVVAMFTMRRNPNLSIRIAGGMIPGPVLSFVLSNSEISINGDADKVSLAEVKGGAYNAEYNAVKKPLDQDAAAEWAIYRTAYEKLAKGDSSAQRSAGQLHAANAAKTLKVKKDYVGSHPDSFISMYFLSTMLNEYDYSGLRAAYDKLSAEHKNTIYAKSIAGKLNSLEATATGKAAIEINKSDENGKIIKLADLKGKFVLIDFWGSWCGPCRASHPHLRALYSKYKAAGFEIVGIAQENGKTLEISKASWKAAIKQDNTNWIQVLNNENADQYDAVRAYGVTAFPTKLLLDRDGKVIMRDIGGDPKVLDDKLSQLLGF